MLLRFYGNTSFTMIDSLL